MHGGYANDEGHVEGRCIRPVAVVNGELLVFAPEHFLVAVDIGPHFWFSTRFDSECLEERVGAHDDIILARGNTAQIESRGSQIFRREDIVGVVTPLHEPYALYVVAGTV